MFPTSLKLAANILDILSFLNARKKEEIPAVMGRPADKNQNEKCGYGGSASNAHLKLNITLLQIQIQIQIQLVAQLCDTKLCHDQSSVVAV